MSPAPPFSPPHRRHLAGALLAAAILLGLALLLAAVLTGATLPGLAGWLLLSAGVAGQQLQSRRLARAVAESRTQHADLRALCDAAHIGIAWITPTTDIIDLSAAASERTGMTRDALIGQHTATFDRVDAAQRAALLEMGRTLRAGDTESLCLREPILVPRGDQWVRITCQSFRARPNGAVTHLGVISQDITAEIASANTLAERHAQLRSSEERLQALFDHAPVGIGYFDIDGTCLLVNHRLCAMVQLPAEELLGRRWNALGAQVNQHDLSRLRELRAELFQGLRPRFAAEMRATLPDGSTVWRRQTGALVCNPVADTVALICIVEEITELKEAEAAARQMALYDPLTGLPNRRLLLDRLEQALRLSQRTGQHGALLFIDLDNFKHLNDARGHDVGDHLLRALAHRLEAGLREQDTVARLGGDEFVVLIEGLAREEAPARATAERLAGKLRLALAQPVALAAGNYFPSASIGAVLFPQAAANSTELLQQADAAMYLAKHSRNAVAFYSSELQSAAEQRVGLERDLHVALAQEQFRLMLQPKFDANSTPVGAEALLRWQHPTRGAISPAEFIPVAEASGLIVPLGQWVLREACALLRAMPPAQGHTLAVNVSPRQFKDPDFVGWLAALLAESGTDAARLTLEITEGLVLELGAEVSERLARLQALGVRISIDDFGTGYSSLAYLKRLPLHELKIDRAFVADLPHDPNGAAVVEAILSMARHLGLSVVAEGVETEAQLAFLKARGCACFQGFLLGRPEPAPAWLARLEAA